MKLFEPFTLKNLQLRNRLVMTPPSTNYANKEGEVTQRMIDFYVERARGGVGFMVVETARLNEGQVFTNHLGIQDDSLIPGLSKLARAIHAEGAKTVLQIHHGGRVSPRSVSGKQPVAFSNFPTVFTKEDPHILTIPEIHAVQESLVAAVVRAQKAGFDGVELHGAHGFLLEQSISPLLNKREDEYGGNFEGRMRFAVELVKLIRERVGGDFLIVYRIAGQENEKGGYDNDYAAQAARKLEEAGVDAFDVSTGPPGTYFVQPGYFPRGCLVPLATGIKKAVKVPVITVGRINNVQLANQILEEGKADLVGMVRALIADPELPKKAIAGKLNDIRPCVACNMGCMERVGLSLDLQCLVNPAAGRETEFKLKPAATAKKVVVVGGGPGGMEAARVAALRGHKVTLFEKSDKLGGQLILAAIPPGKQEFTYYIEYLSKQITKLGVKIELGKEATVDSVLKEKPDVAIVATGTNPIIPPIPGCNSKHVVTAGDVLTGVKKAGQKVVVVGGGLVGVETADFLVDQGKEVTIVEMLPKIAQDMGAVTLRWFVVRRLTEKGVKMLTSSPVQEITETAVIIKNESGLATIPADTVVLAVGARSQKELLDKLQGKVKEVYGIGDCVTPRKAIEAIYEAAKLAREI